MSTEVLYLYVRKKVNCTRVNKIDAMYERSLIKVKFVQGSTFCDFSRPFFQRFWFI